MKKAILIILMLCLMITLIGCQNEKQDVYASDGSQDSIFDSISEVLKDVFE
jgi:uncharacterized lipoprotein NlpE involved in copper resistance